MVTAISGSETGRIGLYGGTFDPVHLGHLAVAEEVRKRLRLATVCFMPAARPPHKTGSAVSSETTCRTSPMPLPVSTSTARSEPNTR